MVHQKEIFKKIGAIIVEINEQYQYLSENPEQLNDLELELFSANADFLSEHVKILRRINKGTAVPPKTEVQPEPVKPEPAPVPMPPTNRTETSPEPVIVQNQFKTPVTTAEQPVLEEPTAYQAAINFEDAVPEAEQTLPEVEVAAQAEAHVETPLSVPSKIDEERAEEIITPIVVIENPVEEVEVVKQDFRSETRIADQGSPTPTLNDLISAQKTQTIQTNSQFSPAAPISDLKAAINLNDKLLFIKELFNGYSLAYSEAIEILNRFDSLEVADTFLKANYAGKNNWASKQNAVDKFYETLKRRYSK